MYVTLTRAQARRQAKIRWIKQQIGDLTKEHDKTSDIGLKWWYRLRLRWYRLRLGDLQDGQFDDV